jgi:hypothetical protein
MDMGSDIKMVDVVTRKNPMTLKNPNGDSLLMRIMVDGSFVTASVAGRRGHAQLGVVTVTMGRIIVKCCHR